MFRFMWNRVFHISAGSLKQPLDRRTTEPQKWRHIVTETTRKRPPAGATAAVAILGIPLVIGLMLFAFLAPTFASGPAGVPLAISGPEQVVDTLTSRLEQAEDATPSVTVYGSDEEVEAAILEREAVGGLVIDPQGATAYTATGNGAPYTQMVEGIATKLEAQGMAVEYRELAPTSPDDPQASGIALLGLPLAFGGIISAAIATYGFRGRKWLKLTVLVGIAAVGSLVATWMLHSVYGTLPGSYWMEWAAIAMGILATSLLTAGLAALIGTPGLAIGAVLTIFVANPLSGLATGPWLLPEGWSTLGQSMPIGATGFLVRSLAFFDGSGAGNAWWVLLTWIGVGFVLLMLDRSSRDYR